MLKKGKKKLGKNVQSTWMYLTLHCMNFQKHDQKKISPDKIHPET
jgi:hypothetical protein